MQDKMNSKHGTDNVFQFPGKVTFPHLQFLPILSVCPLTFPHSRQKYAHEKHVM